MSRASLRSELEAGRLRAAYLLVGDEVLLRDDALAAIREATLASGAEAFDCDALGGDTATPGALLDAVRTLPVMGGRRLVVLREPDSARGARAALAEAIVEAVAELGSASPPTTVLVVVAQRVDGRARWVRAFDDAARVACDAPRGGRDLLAFAKAEAARQGVAFERGALELLAERTGPQLLMLRQEIAKAALLAGPGQRVKRGHVAAGASDVAEQSIWELTDAIGEGRREDALRSLARLLRGGVAPPALLGTLVSHFRKLTRLRHGGRVGGHPFALRKLERQTGRFTQARLLACLRAIHDTDTALKGEGALSPEMALERLVIGLAG